ncbi:WD40 repeat-like protein [Russula ochroleuca]|uniref:WD40 repeat-like protein n=1 Tax=Russula ochroleuca TaxID=152965 RepID=A0A9P5TBF8_9AGAM|nr:WD40 repeat-like protein [Russula ochroleuca]
MESQYIWKPPTFDTSRQPTLVREAHLPSDPDLHENFARSAKWCPDGSLALAHCENRSLQYLDLPQDLLNATLPQSALAPFDPPKTGIFPRAAPILDFIWYPRATPRDVSSFCFVASVRESPVQLLDASDGRLRASYKIVDHRERQIGPHSLSFNFSSDKLYCGFEGAIEVFDLNYPGEGTRLSTTPSKKSRDGLKGIISALAFCPSHDPSYRLYAAGSLSPSSANSANIALFDEDTGEKPVGWVGDVKASVMQLAFNPVKSHILYASFRRQDEIYSWDLRGSTATPLQTFRCDNGSRLETNQKMKFDIDLGGNLMGVGDQNGNVNIFNLGDSGAEPTDEADEAPSFGGTAPTLKYHAHDDAVGSIAFHPLNPLLLSVSGSRHFDEVDSDGEESSDSSVESEVTSRGDARVFIRRHRHRPQPSFRDNSFRLWRSCGEK